MVASESRRESCAAVSSSRYRRPRSTTPPASRTAPRSDRISSRPSVRSFVSVVIVRQRHRVVVATCSTEWRAAQRVVRHALSAPGRDSAEDHPPATAYLYGIRACVRACVRACMRTCVRVCPPAIHRGRKEANQLARRIDRTVHRATTGSDGKIGPSSPVHPRLAAPTGSPTEGNAGGRVFIVRGA